MDATDKKQDWTPPYASWQTLKNTIERMAKDGGVPARIDRSYLSNLPGGAQGEVQTTLKALGLVDDQLHPTTLLGNLVTDEERRPEIVKELLAERYIGPMSLGAMATQAQLEDEFRKFGVQGSTLRKAVRFYLNAAKFAEISLSPHFKAPSADSTVARKTRKPRAGQTEQEAVQTEEVAKPQRESGLHPFIQGLVSALPAPGAQFPLDKQEAWFDTARGIFRLIYETGSDTPQVARPEPAATSGGELD